MLSYMPSDKQLVSNRTGNHPQTRSSRTFRSVILHTVPIKMCSVFSVEEFTFYVYHGLKINIEMWHCHADAERRLCPQGSHSTFTRHHEALHLEGSFALAHASVFQTLELQLMSKLQNEFLNEI